MRVGITVHNFEHPSTIGVLESLFDQGIDVDFVIFHQNKLKRFILQLINNIRTPNNKRRMIFKKHKIREIHNIKDVNSNKFKTLLKRYSPSIIICNSGVINKDIIDKNDNVFLINTHVSNLPKYRGASNVYWALWHNDDVYATVHRIHKGIDEGDVLFQKKIINNNGKLISEGKLTLVENELPKITAEAIKGFLIGKYAFKQQERIKEPYWQWYYMHPILQQIIEKNN